MFPWLEQVVAASTAMPLPEEARAYLLGRGLAPDDIHTHRIGWLPADYTPPPGPTEFLVWQARALREALIFPLCSTHGAVIGLQTRLLTEKRYEKYLPDPKDVYPPVFGLPAALPEIWRTEQVVLVEGVFDYFAVRRYAPNTLAALTASIPTSVRRFLGRYTQRVVALLDMDEAGRHGVDMLLRESDVRGYHIFAPAYRAHDPGDLLTAGYGGDLATLVTSVKFPFGEV